MKDKDFIDELMDVILLGLKIPKVQVEREIGPIIGLFIESIFNSFFNSKNSYVLVSPEFPLKKSNNQSTNVDYLLLNKKEGIILIVELKTDTNSIKNIQMENYIICKEKIANDSADYLRENLEIIVKCSKLKEKYEFIISEFKTKIIDPKRIKKAEIIYIVPLGIKDLIKREEIDHVLSFRDLPIDINHKYSDEWKIIRNKLLAIDENNYHHNSSNVSKDIKLCIYNNVKRFLDNNKNHPIPGSIQIGNSGSGKRPNYQVLFIDGSIKTFNFKGNPHKNGKFNENRLGEKLYWSMLQSKFENNIKFK